MFLITIDFWWHENLKMFLKNIFKFYNRTKSNATEKFI